MDTTGPGPRHTVLEAAALTAEVRTRIGDDSGESEAALQLAEEYYAVVASDGQSMSESADVAGAVCEHWRLGRRRSHGESVVRAMSPEFEGDGWRSDHSVVFIVCDDAAFLVDSVRMALERRGLAVHVTVHPMFTVRRGVDGVVESLVPAGEQARAPVEAWTMMEFDRVRVDELRGIEDDVREALALVHAAVGDFDAMRRRMSDLASDLEHLPPGNVDPEHVESVIRLLRWLTRRNFVLLGSATYDVVADGSSTCLEGSGLGLLRAAHTMDPPVIESDDLLVIGRADAPSRVHRPARPTCIAVRRFDAAGRVRGEHRFIGLFAAPTYRASVFDIPFVRERAETVLAEMGYRSDSHDGRAIRTVLETFPRDEIFEIDAAHLVRIARLILALSDRRLVRVIPLPDVPGAWSTYLVYIPRSRFDARMVERVGAEVAAAADATAVETEVFVSTSPLARITVMVRRVETSEIDLPALERTVDSITRPWADDVRRALVERRGEAEGLELADRLVPGLPDDYRVGTDPREAVDDLLLVDALGEGALTTLISPVSDDPRVWRVKVARLGQPLVLSDLVPVLENLGLRVRDERAHVIDRGHDDGSAVSLHDLGVDVPSAEMSGHAPGDNASELLDEVRRTIELVMAGAVESDGFNRLVVLAALTGHEIAVLRAYAKYLRQIGFPFSQQYIEDALARNPAIARGLIDVFAARFEPAMTDRDGAARAATAAVEARLDAVPSLDDDRIGRTLLALVGATERTNAYSTQGPLAFKFDPSKVPDLPAPRPWAEVWVCSPSVEGVHLRGGPVARGGIRWSDRREDVRVEILGLMKAQMVKNAVIVPVGAKGGFIVKRPDAVPRSADVSREEMEARYREFVTALLEVTDDIHDGRVVPPPGVVRHDADDPYLVVAADKGTSNMSDVANSIAESRGFWLGDAFASGGSAGYDHKEMGITARGAWVSVQRHARSLGRDADADRLTVVGIGDMSGDVFGNGLLRSPHLQLVAAFDHRHIFLDPDPDPERSFAERQRLFALDRSCWADYDPAFLSPGGAVVPRSAKRVEPSPQVCARLGLQQSTMTPDELIRAVLRAPVDLLWNGGVGTYVKASTESHLDVGDRANDAVRIDGCDLRCRMVAEGGNLGFTQRGRIEFALAGGLVNTDAIDNSAGVDCSDHEVNIKILLADVIASGRLDRAARDELLASMTDEIADLVLEDNRAQTLALAIARTQSLTMIDVHRRYLHQLEAEGWLDRSLEYLPSDRELADRQARGVGLAVPEFAVLLAYTKNADIAEIVRTDLPDDPYLRNQLHRSFPRVLSERFGDAIDSHRLRREIVTTALVNEMVNRNGITFDHRMTEETGASIADVARAWITARDILGASDMWERLESLESTLRPDVHLGLLLELRRMVERSTLWLLRHRRPPLGIGDTVQRLSAGVARVRAGLPDVLSGELADAARSVEASRLVVGVPDDLASDSSVWPVAHTAFDVVEIAADSGRGVEDVLRIYWTLFDRLGAIWLWQGIGALDRSDRWRAQARSALRDDLLSTLADLTRDVLAVSPQSPPEAAIARWLSVNGQSVARARVVQADVARSGTRDLTTLSVSLRQLRNLVVASRSVADPSVGR